jgi:hypothetical protein
MTSAAPFDHLVRQTIQPWRYDRDRLRHPNVPTRMSPAALIAPAVFVRARSAR